MDQGCLLKLLGPLGPKNLVLYFLILKNMRCFYLNNSINVQSASSFSCSKKPSTLFCITLKKCTAKLKPNGEAEPNKRHQAKFGHLLCKLPSLNILNVIVHCYDFLHIRRSFKACRKLLAHKRVHA